MQASPGAQTADSVDGALEVFPLGTRQRPVDPPDTRIESCAIAGVQVAWLPRFTDDRGTLVPVIDAAVPLWGAPLVHAYRVTVAPGQIKGWGVHRVQADRYVVACDELRTVLHDGRVAGPTFGARFELRSSEQAPHALLIPPGVWHATQNTGDEPREIFNLPTRPFQHAAPDKWELDPWGDEIVFDWSS